MAQTFSNWDDVPKDVLVKINKICNGDGTSTYYKEFDANKRQVTVYKLSDNKVIFNVDFLTDAQKIKFFELEVYHTVILSNLLHNLVFNSECIRVCDEIYHIPGIVVGTWPHINMYGGMDETGSIHT